VWRRRLQVDRCPRENIGGLTLKEFTADSLLSQMMTPDRISVEVVHPPAIPKNLKVWREQTWKMCACFRLSALRRSS
jgi:hypothetical protein